MGDSIHLARRLQRAVAVIPKSIFAKDKLYPAMCQLLEAIDNVWPARSKLKDGQKGAARGF